MGHSDLTHLFDTFVGDVLRDTFVGNTYLAGLVGICRKLLPDTDTLLGHSRSTGFVDTFVGRFYLNFVDQSYLTLLSVTLTWHGLLTLLQGALTSHVCKTLLFDTFFFFFELLYYTDI